MCRNRRMHGGHETDNMACIRFCHIALARPTAGVHAVPSARRLTSSRRCRDGGSRGTIGTTGHGEPTFVRVPRRRLAWVKRSFSLSFPFARACVHACEHVFSDSGHAELRNKNSDFSRDFSTGEEKKSIPLIRDTRGLLAQRRTHSHRRTFPRPRRSGTGTLTRESLSERSSRPPATILASTRASGFFRLTRSCRARRKKNGHRPAQFRQAYLTDPN